MKKVILALLLTTILATAQSQKMQYLRKRLTVEVEKTIIASYHDWDVFLDASMRYGGAGLEIKESKKWHCYKGGMKISEGKFYGIAGLNDYASMAYSYKNKKALFTYGGWAMVVIGVGMFVTDYAMAYSGDELRNPSALSYIGLGVEVVGVTFAIIGMTRPPKLTKASFAVMVADEYNRQLR